LDKFITDNTKPKHNIEFEKGGFNNRTKKGVGFEKIAIRHMQDGSDGYISLSELTKIGEVIRNGELSINNNKRVYSLYKDNIRFRAITGENKDTKKVITFYSDRVNSTGLGHAAQDYNSATSTNGIIITYKPKTTFKQWLLDLKEQSKEIKEDLKNLKSEDKDIKIGAFVGSKVNEKGSFKDIATKRVIKELQEFKEHITDLKNLANKEEIKHLGKISLDGIKTLAKNSKETFSQRVQGTRKKLNTSINRNIATKEILKQNNQNIKRSERRYKNK